MKKNLIFFIIFILFVFSCATIKKSPWQLSGNDYSVYIPEKIYSFEEAAANLQNVQSELWINGHQPTDIFVDKYSFKAKLKWTETYSQTDYVPSYGGFFIGWNYVPTYSGTYQTSYSNVQKEDTIILTFKDIYDIILGNNYLYVNLNTGKTLSFYMTNRNFVQKMADSIYSILLFHDIKLSPIIGFSYSETSDEEKLNYINKKSKIVYVASVLNNSPAKLAGLSQNDVILEINDQKITDINHCSEIFVNALNDYLKDNNKIIKIKVFHFDEDKNKLINWEERLIKLKPALR
ncbi:MAG: PDZ domain-containing protein [Candidatus Goldbacteria bacterium]|nr:PDZ domain-containing protein [Candidatus Goldiibacteriota bacterium]